MNSLRSSLYESVTYKPYLVCCAKSLRGYLAALTLNINNFKDVTILNGGLISFN